MKHPTPLGFHGIVLRARDPESVARRLRRELGWPILRRSAREIVLGAGPELFFAIQKTNTGAEGVTEIHLAVENLGARRRARPDDLGGDSRKIAASDALSVILREFRRAPRGKWKKHRPRV